MSLDVWLESASPVASEGSGIFVRENGSTREISRAEWEERFPGAEPVVAVRDDEDRSLYSGNITHNLGKMAEAAGIYQHLWRPEELGITKAGELIDPLTAGLKALRADPAKFEAFNSPNGWGLYVHFVPFVEGYLQACEEHPSATVRVDR